MKKYVSLNKLKTLIYDTYNIFKVNSKKNSLLFCYKN